MPEGVRLRDSGKYQAYFEINGRQFSKHFPSQREAVAWRTQKMAEYYGGDFTAPNLGRVTVAQWVDDWLATKRPTWSEGTYTRYESIVRNHIKPGLGHYSLERLRLPDVQRWVNAMEPSAQHSNFPILRMALRYAVKSEYIKRNPCEHVELAHHEADPKTFLEPDELWELLEHEDEQWVKDILLGLAFTGARIGELTAVKPEHVTEDGIKLYATKTKKWRTIPISLPLRPVLERRLAEDTEYVWTSKRGEQLDPRNFRTRRFHPLREKAGHPDLRVHDLRHTCASWLIKGGHNPVQVCAWMGHANPVQTLNTYAHLFREDMGQMAESLGAMWEDAA